MLSFNVKNQRFLFVILLFIINSYLHSNFTPIKINYYRRFSLKWFFVRFILFRFRSLLINFFYLLCLSLLIGISCVVRFYASGKSFESDSLLFRTLVFRVLLLVHLEWFFVCFCSQRNILNILCCKIRTEQCNMYEHIFRHRNI